MQTESLNLCATYSCRMHCHVFTAVGFHGKSLLLRDIWPSTAGTTLRFVQNNHCWWNFRKDFEGAYLMKTVWGILWVRQNLKGFAS